MLAVLDWELSTLGDPLADFSYHLMQWHMIQSDGRHRFARRLRSAGARHPGLAAYVDAYVARTGLDPRPHLAVYLAYNFFRIAAILQGIAGRVRDGTATSEHAAAKAQLVLPLAEMAWAFARKRGRDTASSHQCRKTFALALGGGGARSLAQIAVFEALDDLGLRPIAIAGTSFGALIGAAYAAGMPGQAIRRIVIGLAHDRGAIYARLMSARAAAFRAVRGAVRQSAPARCGKVLRAVPAG